MEQELQLQQDEEEEEEELREHGIYTFLRRPSIVYPMVCSRTRVSMYPIFSYFLPEVMKWSGLSE